MSGKPWRLKPLERVTALLADLRRAGSAGLSSTTLAARLEWSKAETQSALKRYRRAGLVLSDGPVHRMMWFAADLAPPTVRAAAQAAASAARAVPRPAQVITVPKVPPKGMALARDAVAVVPPTVVVQVCPAGRDTRYEATPDELAAGFYASEWRRLRAAPPRGRAMARGAAA